MGITYPGFPCIYISDLAPGLSLDYVAFQVGSAAAYPSTVSTANPLTKTFTWSYVTGHSNMTFQLKVPFSVQIGPLPRHSPALTAGDVMKGKQPSSIH